MDITGIPFTPGIFKRFFRAYIPMCGFQLALGIASNCGMLFLAKVGNEKEITALGTCDLMASLFFESFTIALAEISGVFLAREFGAQRLHDMAIRHQQTNCVLLTLFLAFFGIGWVACDFLLLIGTEPGLAAEATRLMWLSMPYLLLEGYNMNLQSLILSQDISGPFSAYSVVLMAGSLFWGKTFVIDHNMGAQGVVLARLVQELTTLFVYQAILRTTCHPETFRVHRLTSVIRDLRSFLAKFGKTMGVLYGDYFGFYFTSMLLVIKQENTLMSSWSTLGTLTNLISNFSVGFANLIRTNIGNLLGEERRNTALGETKAFLIFQLVISVIISATLAVFHHPIAVLMSDNPAIAEQVSVGIFIYSFFTYFYMCWSPMATLFRLLNLDSLIFLVSGVLATLAFVIGNTFVIVFFKGGMEGMSFVSGTVTMIGVLFYVVYGLGRHKWGEDSPLALSKENSLLIF